MKYSLFYAAVIRAKYYVTAEEHELLGIKAYAVKVEEIKNLKTMETSPVSLLMLSDEEEVMPAWETLCEVFDAIAEAEEEEEDD